MEPISKVQGVIAPLDRSDVDTDQIIPKQFLKRIERTGYGPYAFFDWRYLADGTENPDFILNKPVYKGAPILVTGPNFGCGSSREHAVWALQEMGFKAIIAPSFADIFFNNCLKTGVLPVVLKAEIVDKLMRMALDRPGTTATVDLEQCKVTADGIEETFQIDEFARYCLLNGLDEIGLTLLHNSEIEAYEARRPAFMPSIPEEDRKYY